MIVKSNVKNHTTVKKKYTFKLTNNRHTQIKISAIGHQLKSIWFSKCYI